MSDNMPDFDNMSQEEIMAWMETLAKRQGASEGFTTSADVEIAEIDPNSVVIDEPGYIPYGQEDKQPVEAKPAARPAPVAPPAPVSQPAPAAEPTPAAASAGFGVTGTLAWLESLAAEKGEDLFNLDLSDLPAEAPAAPPPAPAPVVEAAPAVNPMAWLEDLARSQVAEPSLERLGADDEEESEKLDPFAEGVNPMEWLETLAKRQGAKDEELTTGAQMNIPAPVEAEVEEDDYQPFSFDTPPARRSAEPAALEDPADWLSSLAGAEGYSEEGVLATQQSHDAPEEDLSMNVIQDAIADGTVTSEQMQYFLDQQADQLADLPEEAESELEDELQDEDTPLQPAELPDWLSDLKPQETTAAPTPTKPIDALFETPPVAEMPDWLREDVLDSGEAGLESIFEAEPVLSSDDTQRAQPIVVPDEARAQVEVDPNDPWTEAFDAEYEQGGEPDVTVVPDWYQQNVNDPARIAAVEEQIDSQETAAEPPAAELAEAALPEEKDLAAAQPQSVPVWMTGFEEAAEPQPEEVAAVFAEMPDWLKEVEASVSPEDVPDWLVETIAEPEEAPAPAVVERVQEVVAPPPVSVAPPAPPPPARVLAGEAGTVLQRARDKEQSGDLDGALFEYEAMIRSSTELEVVVAELTELVKSYKTTPAVYRVLGDGLMRQGKLQAALNTYRAALNQL